jgi:hypothetical protein
MFTGPDGADMVFARWKNIVTKILSSGARVVMMGTKPERASPTLQDAYQNYDQLVKTYVTELAADTENFKPSVVFIDVYRAFLELRNPEVFYRPDNLHLSPAGYALWNRWTDLALNNELCVIWNGDKCELQQVDESPWTLSSASGACPDGYDTITSEIECSAAAKAGSSAYAWQGRMSNDAWPTGCFYCMQGSASCRQGTWFNIHAEGSANDGAQSYCRLS